MAEYRPVPDDLMDERARVTSYAFDAAAGPHDPDADVDERVRRYFDVDEPRGLFDGEELLATCGQVEFAARLRGEWLPLAGLTLVASPPEHRREGYVAELLAEQLAEYRERDWPLSALWPFDERFYARYGWATGFRVHRATVDPSALAPVADRTAGDGTFRRVGPSDHDRLDPVFEAWLDGTNLATRRTADWWRDRAFHTYETELFGYAWERDGEPRGYLLYDVNSGDGKTLSVREMAYADDDAYLNLLGFCHDHDSQVDGVELVGPRQDRLLDVVDDRDAVDVACHPGKMVRIVDVPMALEAVPYPVDDADVVLDVTDDHAPWNDRRFRVAVRGGQATVEPTGADPGATVDVGTLSQLFVGYRPVEAARSFGGLDVESADAAATLDALFPTRPVYLPESF